MIKRSLGEIDIKSNGNLGILSWPKEVYSNEKLLKEFIKTLSFGKYSIYGLFDDVNHCQKIEAIKKS